MGNAPAGPHTFDYPQMSQSRTEYVVLIRQKDGSGDWFHTKGDGEHYATSRKGAETMLAEEIAKTNAEIADMERILSEIPEHDTDEKSFYAKQVEQVRGTEHAIFARKVSKYRLA